MKLHFLFLHWDNFNNIIFKQFLQKVGFLVTFAQSFSKQHKCYPNTGFYINIYINIWGKMQLHCVLYIKIISII